MTERNALVVSGDEQERDVSVLCASQPTLHVLHEDVRLPLWRDWLAHAELPARFADGGFEFSNLGQVIEAAKRGVGLAIVDINMVGNELASGTLRRVSDVVVCGPYGYWLDIPDHFRSCEKVQIFAKWMRNEAAFDLQGKPKRGTFTTT
jgi:DNA-binding transcriptional LysR family regulator